MRRMRGGFAHARAMIVKTSMIDIPFEKIRAIGFAPAMANQLGLLAQQAPAGSRLLRVVETQRDWYRLHDGETEQVARCLPALVHELQSRGNSITIGDWVLATAEPAGELWILAVLPPVTQIARRANDGRRQALASNVDTALLVMGLDDDFNPRRAERYIALVRASGVAPVVVLTKADLRADAPDRFAGMRQRLPASIPIVAVNAMSAVARQEIAPWLGAGQTLVLLGASGAGKSTLTNTLCEAEGLQSTGHVRAGDGRGQHTTTARSLHRCPAGACIIDTPGLRTWSPDADARTLAATFDDVAALSDGCRFRDCRHQGEPGCAVRAEVPADRLANYQKLLRDAQRGEQTPLDRIVQRQKWKRLHKAGATRALDKRG